MKDIVSAYEARSEKGFSHNKLKTDNQDSCFIQKDFANYSNVWLAGICDGHGAYGHLVSDYIKKHFPGYLV